MPTKSTPAKKPAHSVEYINNPFKLALDGINLILLKAKGVAILLIVLSILAVFGGFFPDSPDKPMFDEKEFTQMISERTPEQWAVGGVIFIILALAYIFVSAMISGIGAYAAARVAKGYDVKLSEAFHAVLDRFFSYIWLQVIQIVKIVLWSLLLIVPGFIMAIRYSLANVAFFDKGLKGDAAIKESLKLTKGAWLTTFASQALFNIVTLGVISELVTNGARAVLYRQLDQFKKDQTKPTAHPLSWVTLFLPFALILLFIMFIVFFVILAAAAGVTTF